MRISDWSSDVCSSDLNGLVLPMARDLMDLGIRVNSIMPGVFGTPLLGNMNPKVKESLEASVPFPKRLGKAEEYTSLRSEEHTSELQSLMRISYAVFCLKKKKNIRHNNKNNE